MAGRFRTRSTPPPARRRKQAVGGTRPRRVFSSLRARGTVAFQAGQPAGADAIRVQLLAPRAPGMQTNCEVDDQRFRRGALSYHHTLRDYTPKEFSGANCFTSSRDYCGPSSNELARVNELARWRSFRSRPRPGGRGDGSYFPFRRNRFPSVAAGRSKGFRSVSGFLLAKSAHGAKGFCRSTTWVPGGRVSGTIHAEPDFMSNFCSRKLRHGQRPPFLCLFPRKYGSKKKLALLRPRTGDNKKAEMVVVADVPQAACRR